MLDLKVGDKVKILDGTMTSPGKYYWLWVSSMSSFVEQETYITEIRCHADWQGSAVSYKLNVDSSQHYWGALWLEKIRS